MSSQPVVIVAGGAGKSLKWSGPKTIIKGDDLTVHVKKKSETEDLLILNNNNENKNNNEHNNENENGAVTKECVKNENDVKNTSVDNQTLKELASQDLERFEVVSSSELYTAMNDDKKASKSQMSEVVWLGLCFFGIMVSFVCYGLLLEYTTSGDRKLHELSFLFVTSLLYTITAAAGRYVRDETPTTIPPARFAILGLTSMGSTFCSVRSLRYVIYPIQVLAKSCKPVPVMIMGAFMGKKYPLHKYLNVILIVAGVGMFMGGGQNKKKIEAPIETEQPVQVVSQLLGIILLFISLCFDGGTGAYEDKLMSVHSVEPFDLMYNIQLGKTIIAGVGLLVFNQVHHFLQMCQDMGFILVALGLSGAIGQVFIFVTISKFGALTCSIIGLARKVTTIVASIYFYGHTLNAVQTTGLGVCVGAMIMNFTGKKTHKGNVNGDHVQQNNKTDKQKNAEENEPLYRDYIDETKHLHIELGSPDPKSPSV
uniref:Sugar phosphate transporter domain-containing protein n=1 Tax=Eucampia antarctica TaxID=49252 RepID=A0A7S2S6P9_9STRA|mmetsp:Transcript_3521/g.3337  ORF Transcript_3521/g.3337 Transcript_3521/m.3337 type:complete len:482 (+) Transcript_3521:173-1618(+)